MKLLAIVLLALQFSVSHATEFSARTCKGDQICVIALSNIQIGDELYDVKFVAGSFANLVNSEPFIYLDDNGGAQAAANAINDFLNNASIAGVVRGPAPGFDTSYTIPYSLSANGKTLKVTASTNPGQTPESDWTATESSSSPGNAAVFAVISRVCTCCSE